MYVLLGSNGNITSQAAALLLAAGAPVRVVGRSAKSLAKLQAAGAMHRQKSSPPRRAACQPDCHRPAAPPA